MSEPTQQEQTQTETLLDLDSDTPIETPKPAGPACTDEVCEACQ